MNTNLGQHNLLSTLEKIESVSKLKEIVSQRFGKNLRFSLLNDTAILQATKSLSYSVKLGDLRVPIIVNGQFLATAVIPDVLDLDDEQHLSLAHLAQMVLEPVCYNIYLNTQASFIALPASDYSNENVIEFYRKDKAKEISHEPNNPGAALVFLLSSNPKRILRVAELIHEISGRWASLPLTEIEDSVECADDLKLLGEITLHIEDVLSLSPRMQNILADYHGIANRHDNPLIIIGANAEKADSLDPASPFKKILNSNRVEADRLPLDPATLREAIELMME